MFSKGPVKGPRRRGRAYYIITINSEYFEYFELEN